MGSRVHNNHNMDDLRRQSLASLLKQLLELLQSALGHQHGIRVETSVKIKTQQKKPQQTVINQVTLSLLSIGGKGKSSKITATPCENAV